jgi:hypothetical protein
LLAGELKPTRFSMPDRRSTLRLLQDVLKE